MADFKRLSDVEVVETPTDTANVLIEEDGVIKKAPKTAVGGYGCNTYFVVVADTGGSSTQFVTKGIYEAVKNMLDNYVPVQIIVIINNGDECFYITTRTIYRDGEAFSGWVGDNQEYRLTIYSDDTAICVYDN